MSELKINKEYKNWLFEIKSKIKNSQIKAALKVNTELIKLYWEIGAMIVEKQEKAKWGSGLIKQLSGDLKNEFPSISGFSMTNLKYCKRFYLFYKSHFSQQAVDQNKMVQISQQLVDQIPWGHNILIFSKSKSINEALFYIKETINNNWSRSILEYQVETNLYNRQGKAISNFKNTLPKPESDLAQELLKDPYNFDFLTLAKQAKEKDLEIKLIKHISDFLLELGKGFAYMGRQFKLKVGEKDFFTDLLFYNTKLKAYIVIELKITEFKPEFIGKLNFYTTVINETIKDETDKPTIGILLCKTKDNIVVDYSIKSINKPIGVSEYTYTELPEEIKNQLPSEKQLKETLKEIENE